VEDLGSAKENDDRTKPNRYLKVDVKSQREKNSTPLFSVSDRLAIRRGTQVLAAKNQQPQTRM
jgi:hypothetical protein